MYVHIHKFTPCATPTYKTVTLTWTHIYISVPGYVSCSPCPDQHHSCRKVFGAYLAHSSPPTDCPIDFSSPLPLPQGINPMCL